MRYSPLGLIKALFETLFDLYPNKRRNVVHGDKTEAGWSLKELGDAYAAARDDPGEKYWQSLLNQKLDEKEREDEIVLGIMVEDYESKHSKESDESGEMPAQDESNESENIGQSDFEESSDFNSDDFDADSGVPDYIG